MIEIIVDKIDTTDNIISGCSTKKTTVIENIKIGFHGKQLELLDIIEKGNQWQGNGIYVSDIIGQYIIYAVYISVNNMCVFFFDFRKSNSNEIESYLEKRKFPKETINKLIAYCHQHPQSQDDEYYLNSLGELGVCLHTNETNLL